MLLVVLPRTNVFFAIRPFKSAFTVFDPVLELSFVFAAVFPLFNTFAFHVVQTELTSVCFFNISKIIFSKTLKFSVDEVSFVITSIIPLEPALSILLSFEELS